jgi:hypothetical protein
MKQWHLHQHETSNYNLQIRQPGDEVEDCAVLCADRELVEASHRDRLHNGNPELNAVLSRAGFCSHAGERMFPDMS